MDKTILVIIKVECTELDFTTSICFIMLSQSCNYAQPVLSCAACFFQDLSTIE